MDIGRALRTERDGGPGEILIKRHFRNGDIEPVNVQPHFLEVCFEIALNALLRSHVRAAAQEAKRD